MVEKIFCIHHRREIKLDLNVDVFCYEERVHLSSIVYRIPKISKQGNKVEVGYIPTKIWVQSVQKIMHVFIFR